MIRKLILPALVLVALGGGLAAGEWLRPAPPIAQTDAADPILRERARGDLAWFRFPTQFFVPVMRGHRLDSVMVLSLTLEIPKSAEPAVFQNEHRLRDAFLRSLLIHANTGGFDGNFTGEGQMRRLRDTLLRTAHEVGGSQILDVLIEDIARQDSS
ncbi:MAG: hypothetical protein Q4G36_08015 [Paracoccus sp. (in: a-proteobacteria)]|nr:hypothetical protein [Paracoccus sp. (in: a-proteobacteria)]